MAPNRCEPLSRGRKPLGRLERKWIGSRDAYEKSRRYVVLMLLAMSTASAQADPAKIARGKDVYAEKKCAVCHAIGGKGGRAGPELSDAGARRDAQWLKNLIKDPQATNPKAKMMPFKGREGELVALVACLGSLK